MPSLSSDTLDFFVHHPALSHLIRALVCDPDNAGIRDAMLDYCRRNRLGAHADKIAASWEQFVNDIKNKQEIEDAEGTVAAN